LWREVTNEEFKKAWADENNRKIVSAVSRKFKIIPYEDRKSFELICVWKTLAQHVEGKGNKFTTSLWTISNWEFLREYKQIAKRSKIKTVSLEKFQILADEEDCTLEHLKECINLLPTSHQEILTLYLLERNTMQEIGNMFGFSKETARQRINKAMILLRRYFNEREES
jgi:RNA polymerase sigma factor (sigma-70 family)